MTFGPPLAPDYSFVGCVPAPPLCVAVSTDGGLSWATRQLVAPGGLAPRLLYDPASRVLALARSALRFPHAGHCFQYSADQGRTWSTPLVFGSETTPTTGELAMLNADKGRFTIFFDETASHVGTHGSGCAGGEMDAGVRDRESDNNAVKKVSVLVQVTSAK
jgi:hypothetical protein